MQSDLHSSAPNPDKKWTALFVAVIILGIAAFAFGIMESLASAKLGYSTGLSEFSDMPRRLGAVIFVAKYSPHFTGVIFAIWAANKLRHNRLVSGTTFQSICFVMIGFLIINQVVYFFEFSGYGDFISDLKLLAVSSAREFRDIALLVFMAADFKRNFVRPPHVKLRSDIVYGHAGQGVFNSLLILGIAAFLLSMAVIIDWQVNQEGLPSVLGITYLALRVLIACAMATIILWGLVSIKASTLSFKERLSHAALVLSISTITMLLLVHAVNAMTDIEAFRERYFGEYPQWIYLVSGIIHTLIMSVILIIAWASLSRDPTQNTPASNDETKVDKFEQYKRRPDTYRPNP